MQERWPSSTTESFSIEVAGHRHRGQRVILTVSDTEIRQEVRYGWLRKVDPDVYRLGEGDFMRSMAKEILWRLVMESKPGATGRPAKVAPRPATRPRPRRSEE